MKRLFSNYIFVLANQVLSMIVPIITMPYVSRVLRPEGIGQQGFVVQVVGIFVLFAMAGVPMYGTKEVSVAKAKGKEAVVVSFWSIYTIQVLIAAIVFLLYLLFVFIFLDNSTLFLISIFTMLAAMVDVSWYFFGMERAKTIAVRNMVLRVISVICIFLFVNHIDDLPIYVLILSLSTFLGQVIMWHPLLKEVKISFPKREEVMKHIQPVFMLFLPSLVILTYGHLNGIILRMISGYEQLGFYRQAFQIVFLTLGIMTSLSTVMLPRMANEFSSGHIDKIKVYLRYVLQFVLFIAIPLTLGLIIISDNFVIWFLGAEFQPVSILLYIIAAKILLVGLSNVFGLQVLVAIGRQNKYTIAVSAGALCSIVVNILFAHRWGAIATAIALLVAEIVAVLLQMIFARKFYRITVFLKDFFKYGVVSVLMIIVIWISSSMVSLSMISLTIFQVIIGGATYIGILLIVRDSLILRGMEIIRRRK